MFEVFAIDSAGNPDPTPARLEWTVVVPPPPNTAVGTDVIVEFTHPVAASVTFASVSVAGYTSLAALESAPALPAGYVAAGARYYDVDTTAEYSAPVTVCLPYEPSAYDLPVRVLHHDGTAWVDVTLSTDASTGIACGVADGLSPFAIAAADATVVPETAIVSGPDASTPSSTATFTFSSTDPLADFECVLDDPLLSWGSCDTPHLLEDLLPGSHQLLVRAVNTTTATPTPRRRATGGPSRRPTRRSSPGRPRRPSRPGPTSSSPRTTRSRRSSARSTGRRTAPARRRTSSSISCPAGTSCSSARRTTPARSTRARPATSGRSRRCPTRRSSSGPEALEEDGTATFTFTSNLQNVTFECALDEAVEGGFAPCSSPVTYENLIFGEHDFAVRAKDAAGNVDPTPAEWSWEVGGFAPPVVISSGPDVTTESRTATFEFAADGNGLQYECSLDGGAFSLCLSPKTYNGVPLGPHSFEVRVLVPDEAAEPEETVWEWTVVDGTPPETTIVWGPADPSYTNDPETGQAIATFAFESNDPVATFQCALDGNAWANCPDPAEFTNLTPGRHFLRVRAMDVGLQVDPTPASWEWTVILDATPPVTTITTAEVIAAEGVFTAIFAFSANEPVSDFECQIDSEPFEQCESPMEYSDLNPGNHVFRVRAIDLALNHEHPPASRTFAVGVDDVAPDTRIVSGPPASTTDDWASFDLEATEEVLYYECAIETEPGVGAVWEECYDPVQYVELEPGEHTFQVRAVDLALNTDPTPAVWTWTYEPAYEAPETTILQTPPNPQLTTTAVFQFSAVGPEITFECAIDAEPFESCESPYLIEELLPGEHVFFVRATDVFLNVEPDAGELPVARDRTAARANDRSDAARPEPGPEPHLHLLLGRAECDLRVPDHAVAGAAEPVRAVLVAALVHEPAGRRVPVRGARGERVRDRRRDPGRVELRGRRAARHDHRRPGRPRRPRAGGPRSPSPPASRAPSSSASSTVSTSASASTRS